VRLDERELLERLVDVDVLVGLVVVVVSISLSLLEKLLLVVVDLLERVELVVILYVWLTVLHVQTLLQAHGDTGTHAQTLLQVQMDFNVVLLGIEPSGSTSCSSSGGFM
jgi:hypothetical protein